MENFKPLEIYLFQCPNQILKRIIDFIGYSDSQVSLMLKERKNSTKTSFCSPFLYSSARQVRFRIWQSLRDISRTQNIP